VAFNLRFCSPRRPWVGDAPTKSLAALRGR
jgi:hypothetical protein